VPERDLHDLLPAFLGRPARCGHKSMLVSTYDFVHSGELPRTVTLCSVGLPSSTISTPKNPHPLNSFPS
jgi:hypothetical protein